MIFEDNLDKCKANFSQITPISFLRRAASVYPNYDAIVYKEKRRSWKKTYDRCNKFASAIKKLGVNKGETVSIIAPNIPEHFEAHFSIPMSGAVLNSINIRLDVDAIAFIIDHAETKVLLVDSEFSEVVSKALKKTKVDPYIIIIEDVGFLDDNQVGDISYEDFLIGGDESFTGCDVLDEWNAITLNYTSGTTGDPKGVVYHHRGAYLNAISNILSWNMQPQPIYLWTLPLFHCNGWCFPWTIAAQAGVNVCLRQVNADNILESISKENVNYFCAAPIVLNMLKSRSETSKIMMKNKVNVMTAGAAPPTAIISSMEEIGFSITHVYGLTETYGPSVVCDWNAEWNDESPEEKSRLKSRQGVRAPMLDGLMVADPLTLQAVPKDGSTIGEIFMRGNVVMKGYLKNASSTKKAFSGGWFHSGDLAVWHKDGYIEIKDRSKDIVISGGENISSIEIEGILYNHPSVEEAAVVAKKDDKWGEIPCAFIKLKDNVPLLKEKDIIDFCRNNMAGFKVPKTIFFGPLPKTSTGKIQKYILRDKANSVDLKH